MPGTSESSDKSPYIERVLDSRSMLSHHAHVKIGRRRDPRCTFCGGGLDAVVKEVQTDGPGGPRVVEDPRSDEERPATHTPDNGESKPDASELYWKDVLGQTQS